MLAIDTTTEAVTSRMANTIVVVANAQAVWVAPTVMVWAARPARSGPVQPNPARRYPNPYTTSLRAGCVTRLGLNRRAEPPAI